MREKPGLLDNTEENSEMRANVCMTVRVRSTFPIREWKRIENHRSWKIIDANLRMI